MNTEELKPINVYPELNAEKIKTKYGDYQAPGPIDDYLAFRYGPNWKTPSNSKGIYMHQV